MLRVFSMELKPSLSVFSLLLLAVPQCGHTIAMFSGESWPVVCVSYVVYKYRLKPTLGVGYGPLAFEKSNH